MTQIRVLESVLALLDEAGIPYMLVGSFASDALARRGQFNLVHFETAWKVDLIIRKDRPFSRTEFGRRQVGSLGQLAVPINTAEDVILSKLEWARASGSERQLRDAAGVITAWGERLDWEYLALWAGELSVSDLLAEARTEAGLP